MPRYHGGESYQHPERSIEIHVSHPNPKLDDPPAPDEGEILSVNFEYTNGSRYSFIRCQACRISIQRSAPHTFVFIFLYNHDDSAIKGNYKHVHLCNRACWKEWAARS